MNFCKGHIKFSLLPALVMVVFFLAGLQNVSAAAPETIHVKPFTVHAQKDISFLKDAMRNMMASRLAANSKLQVIEEADKADYLLEGAITAIGNTLSISAQIITKDGSQPPATYYASAASENDIIKAVDQLAANISQQSFAKSSAPMQIAQPTAPSVPAVSLPAVSTPPLAFQTAHPDRAFIHPTAPVVAPMASAQPSSPVFISPSAITEALGFSKTQNLDMAIQDISVADLDGDGVDDIVVAGKNEIMAFHLNGSRLARFGTISLPSSQKIISMMAADLNGNGLAEIFISAVSGSRPLAMAVEWQLDRFNYLFQNQRFYIKPVTVPGRGLILAGQQSTVNDPFADGIFELSVVDGQLVRGEALPVPDGINVFSFALADLDGDGATEVITLDDSDKLRVLMAGGKQLWQSDDHFGGSLRYVGGGSDVTRRRGGDKNPVVDQVDGSQDKTYIPSRIIITDLNNDKLPDVVVNKNMSTASRVLKNMKSYPSGEIHGLVWSGIGLAELWRTKKIDGYVASYDFRSVPGSGQAALYVGLIVNSGWLDMLSAKDSTVLIYPLDLGTAATN
ncbi:MAG: VCBS repeat-containing protein [Proteobacteria bacterium]|nr:VCBS repeat-containing protein [Pseudomonadota bacterium]MBU1641187.1 VCBS repeat-containing protein [Pseudomonadota bacterium]